MDEDDLVLHEQVVEDDAEMEGASDDELVHEQPTRGAQDDSE